MFLRGKTLLKLVSGTDFQTHPSNDDIKLKYKSDKNLARIPEG